MPGNAVVSVWTFSVISHRVRAPGPHQVLVRVHVCAACRTDLHVVDGDLAVR